MEKIVHEKNIEQWNGMAEIYHSGRPTIPGEMITKIILSWLQKAPDTVVDIGNGTGRSTTIWKHIAKNVIGISRYQLDCIHQLYEHSKFSKTY